MLYASPAGVRPAPAVDAPAKSGNSFSIILGSFLAILLLGLVVLGVLFYQKYGALSQPAPTQKPVVIVVTSKPQQVNAQPTNTPISTARPIPTPRPATQAPPPAALNRCPLFEGLEMKVVYMDWQSGAPLTFYVKMPGGVIGLEKKITGDTQPWNYSAKIGDKTTDDCNIIEGYEDRLYCNINLPSGYAGSYRSFDLYVNGCSESIFTQGMNDLPAYSGGGSSEGGGTPGGLNTCGNAPSNTDLSAYQAWCTCRGGTYSAFYPAGQQPFGSCTVP